MLTQGRHLCFSGIFLHYYTYHNNIELQHALIPLQEIPALTIPSIEILKMCMNHYIELLNYQIYK